ncbi:hypothetical protein L596_019714 [Steinernema carpocapsae]|uniref:Bromo domain-containing protein n=1 Tax=Steinernema carpocapsae TaxID=34508 RepID=A0A4U5MRH7_STECR|nr:hypothetical protein L596_019714 [Steinernema carpocapsae]
MNSAAVAEPANDSGDGENMQIVEEDGASNGALKPGDDDGETSNGDLTMAVDEDEEPSNGALKMAEEDDEQNPWGTPRAEPINGVVQPRVVPPPGKPTRHTNQLEFMAQNVLKPALKHKHAWPFLKPVDTNRLNIPDYHKVIKRPMDMTTIEKRLKNCYYYSAKDCMKDIMTVFNNCYTYNPSHYEIHTMAKNLEKLILSKCGSMPMEDFQDVFQNCYKFNQNEDDVSLMCRNIQLLYEEKLKAMPSEEVEISRPSGGKRGKTAKRGGGAVGGGRGGRGSVPSLPVDADCSATDVLDFFHNATLQGALRSSLFMFRPFLSGFVQHIVDRIAPGGNPGHDRFLLEVMSRNGTAELAMSRMGRGRCLTWFRH